MSEGKVHNIYCHKDLSQFCKREECPMWFIPPKPEADGDCAECLNEKQIFWETIKKISDEMGEKKDTSNLDSPLKLLNRRYSSGEINEEIYIKMRTLLNG